MSLSVWTFLQLGSAKPAAGCCQGVGPQIQLTFCIVANSKLYLHLRQIEFKILRPVHKNCKKDIFVPN
jgi:hypothetical protein